MNSHDQDIRLTPITPHLGAVVHGIDFAQPLSNHQHHWVLEAMAQHLVLVAKDQNISPLELRNLATGFGPAHLHHRDDSVVFAGGIQEVLELRREPADGHLFGGGGWHADVTFQKPAGYFSFLHSKIVPEVGGDTGYASTVAAFEALSPGMQALLRKLNAVHSYDGPHQPERQGLTAVHPVVRHHPVSGHEGLYLNTMFVTRFEGMTREESRPLIDQLERHMTRLDFTCRIRWKPGQLVIWDNRFTLHLPCDDFANEPRFMIRCATLEPETL
ncbi:MAG: TauD/TfdA family dioxygenase [Alphaproteobacteria bacterium]|nr:TauD/TfdA family dioxygenase [Alphaproteobacteria bacterium]